MLAQDTDEVELVEAKQNDKLILSLTIISCLLHVIGHNLYTKYTQANQSDERTKQLQ